MYVRILLVFLAVLIRTPLHAAEPLAIAAASDLVYCLEEVNKTLAKTHPEVVINVTTGSSGNFFAQIKNGAPFDLFLSADVQYPRDLIKAGLADEKSLTIYAVGRIALWTTKADVDVSKGLSVITTDAVRKLAIANPDHAPYGRAAKAALEHEKIWLLLTNKVVLGENISATTQLVETGNAEAGIVALSLLLSPKLANKGHYWEIPESLHPRLEQAAVITNKGIKHPQAQLYLDFLRSEDARRVFDRYGFRLPRES
jgi:molybdate transport system substrate-binding protein